MSSRLARARGSFSDLRTGPARSRTPAGSTATTTATLRCSHFTIRSERVNMAQTQAGILFSQLSQLGEAVAALGEWQANAKTVHVRVNQLNLELLDENDEPTGLQVIVERSDVELPDGTYDYTVRP